MNDDFSNQGIPPPPELKESVTQGSTDSAYDRMTEHEIEMKVGERYVLLHQTMEKGEKLQSALEETAEQASFMSEKCKHSIKQWERRTGINLSAVQLDEIASKAKAEVKNASKDELSLTGIRPSLIEDLSKKEHDQYKWKVLEGARALDDGDDQLSAFKDYLREMDGSGASLQQAPLDDRKPAATVKPPATMDSDSTMDGGISGPPISFPQGSQNTPQYVSSDQDQMHMIQQQLVTLQQQMATMQRQHQFGTPFNSSVDTFSSSQAPMMQSFGTPRGLVYNPTIVSPDMQQVGLPSMQQFDPSGMYLTQTTADSTSMHPPTENDPQDMDQQPMPTYFNKDGPTQYDAV